MLSQNSEAISPDILYMHFFKYEGTVVSSTAVVCGYNSSFTEIVEIEPRKLVRNRAVSAFAE
jgi:hypothetical protein